jgi:hypothetical protein
MTRLIKAGSWLALFVAVAAGLTAANCGAACARHDMAGMPTGLFSEISGLPCDLSTFIRLLGVCSTAFSAFIFLRIAWSVRQEPQ